MANKRIIELQERTSIDMGDWLIVDSSTSTRKLSLATLFNYMTYTSMIFVTELPTTDISTTTIYLVPHSGSTTDWDEYIYRDNDWVLIGTSTIDLSAIYQTKTDNSLQTTSKQIVGAINEVNNDLTVIGDTVIQNGSQTNVANNLNVAIVQMPTITKGTYIVTGWLNFQSTNTTGSRCGRFTSSSYTGKETEIAPNTGGYTQMTISDIVTFDADVSTFSLQCRQTSGELMNVSGQVKMIRIK